MVRKDDRTEEQRKTHYFAVVMRDSFMSGWGAASSGYSRCAWACPSLDAAEQLEPKIRERSEARYVGVVDLRTYRAPRGTAHFHIYVKD